MKPGLGRWKGAFVGIVALALLGAAPDAAAQPKGEKSAQDTHAKELFAKGDAAYAEGRYEEALAAFQEAYALSGRPQLLFNVSNALERLGRYAEAVEALEKYLASGKAKERDVVQKRLTNLKKRVEEQKKEQEQKAKEEEEKRAEEKRRNEESQPGPVTSPVVVQPPIAEKPTPVLPIVLIGAGGALIVTGAVFGILTLGARSDAADGCTEGASGNLCSGDARSALDREKTFGLVTDITLASGIVATGVGVYLLLTAKPGEQPPKAAASPVRFVGRPGGGGVELVGSF